MNELLNQQFVQIGAMQPEELVSAIAQPALRVGLKIDPDLIAQIINDMKGEPGALPLMQFALMAASIKPWSAMPTLRWQR
jgi:hypothetical protein